MRDPSNVGAIVPVSQVATKELLKELSVRSGTRSWNVLDAGAGIGNISEEILSRLREGDHLDLVEIDEQCCEYMREKFRDDKRVRVICKSILDWKPEKKYDFIVSTLPFNNFEAKIVGKILEHYLEISQDGALCSYVEYMGLGKIKELFTNESYRIDMERRRKCLSEFHKGHLIERGNVYNTLFPCYVYHLQLHQYLCA